MIYAEEFFVIHGIPGPGSRAQIITDVSGLDQALRLGRQPRDGERRDHRRVRFKFKNLTFILFFFCLDRKMTKRRNDETTKLQTTKRQNLLKTVDSSTAPSFGNGPVRKQSFFRFEREIRRFVVSIVRRVESVHSFA